MSAQETPELRELAQALREDPEMHRRLVRALVRMVKEDRGRARRLTRLRKLER